MILSDIGKTLASGKLKVWNLGNKIFYWTLARFEPEPVRRELQYAPTFIVCPPRSGSTVLMQALTTALPVSYFTDSLRLTLALSGRPLPRMSALLAKRFRQESEFDSSYGRSESIYGPAEGEKYWKFWFDKRKSHTGRKVADITEDQIVQVTNAVGVTEDVWGGPFINKTVTLSVYIPALVEIFPNALFIHLQRDPVDEAQSLLKARTEKFRDWFGPMPDECEGKEYSSTIESVCDQIATVTRLIERMKKECGQSRFIDIKYDELCADPQGTVDRIADFMTKNGAPVARSTPLPASFSFSTGQKVSDEDYKYIVEYFANQPVTS